jgi:hypothetical protein
MICLQKPSSLDRDCVNSNARDARADENRRGYFRKFRFTLKEYCPP